MGNDANYSTVTVYPSTEMHVICPYCSHHSKILRDYPPEEDFTATCSACKQPIAVHINLRKSYRKKIGLEAFYQIRGVNRPPRKGTVLDISRGGISFKCYKSMHEKVGNVMSFSFALPPREETIRVNAEIVRIIEETSTTVSMGLKFRNLGEYEEMQIGYFLKP